MSKEETASAWLVPDRITMCGQVDQIVAGQRIPEGIPSRGLIAQLRRPRQPLAQARGLLAPTMPMGLPLDRLGH